MSYSVPYLYLEVSTHVRVSFSQHIQAEGLITAVTVGRVCQSLLTEYTAILMLGLTHFAITSDDFRFYICFR